MNAGEQFYVKMVVRRVNEPCTTDCGGTIADLVVLEDAGDATKRYRAIRCRNCCRLTQIRPINPKRAPRDFSKIVRTLLGSNA